ncbi:hypothetical protein ACFWMS_29485, partial [Peribacillus butanolivorans]|uniref:hypothetical protein n=1 Tax=Peribacillus butanolivorans TaxID=421767 RepID=UPI003662FC3C
MSVFAGSFELDAAESILNENLNSDNVLDVVSSLVDKSILIREESNGAVRFRMLYTIRDYGAEKLKDRGETTQWRHLHQQWYLDLARRADDTWLSEHQSVSIGRLSRELPNLREALTLTMNEPEGSEGTFLLFVNILYRFWLAHGMTREGRYWIECALDQCGADDHDAVELAHALFSHSAWACMQGDMDIGRSSVDRARALDAENADSVLVTAYAAKADGLFSLFINEAVRARELLEGSLD